MGNEEWKTVGGYEGLYEVSRSGKVRNSKGLELKFEQARSGHLRIGLYKPGEGYKHHQVHRLVARAFLGFSYLDVLHWDDDPRNNCVENLRYGTDRENWQDSVRNGKRRDARFTCPKGHPYAGDNLVGVAPGSPSRRCRTCELSQARKQYKERLIRGLPPGDPRHGSYAGYGRGCRESCCSGANKRYKAEYYRKGRGLAE